MIEKVLQAKNLYKAYRKVVANKGAAGIDQMKVSEFSSQWEEIKGKTRIPGVPTVIDRWLQQAVSQQLASKFELGFEEESFGFRPQKNLQMAVRRSLKHINDGHQDIVEIDGDAQS